MSDKQPIAVWCDSVTLDGSRTRLTLPEVMTKHLGVPVEWVPAEECESLRAEAAKWEGYYGDAMALADGYLDRAIGAEAERDAAVARAERAERLPGGALTPGEELLFEVARRLGLDPDAGFTEAEIMARLTTEAARREQAERERAAYRTALSYIEAYIGEHIPPDLHYLVNPILDTVENVREELAGEAPPVEGPRPDPALMVGMDTSWPVFEVLRHLVRATGYLLDRHNYDRHGWEIIDHARQAGIKHIEAAGLDPLPDEFSGGPVEGPREPTEDPAITRARGDIEHHASSRRIARIEAGAELLALARLQLEQFLDAGPIYDEPDPSDCETVTDHNCRRCDVCRDVNHHWMEGFDEDEDGELVDPDDPRWQCKHCEFSMPYCYLEMDPEEPEDMYQARKADGLIVPCDGTGKREPTPSTGEAPAGDCESCGEPMAAADVYDGRSDVRVHRRCAEEAEPGGLDWLARELRALSDDDGSTGEAGDHDE